MQGYFLQLKGIYLQNKGRLCAQVLNQKKTHSKAQLCEILKQIEDFLKIPDRKIRSYKGHRIRIEPILLTATVHLEDTRAMS